MRGHFVTIAAKASGVSETRPAATGARLFSRPFRSKARWIVRIRSSLSTGFTR